MGAKKGLSAKPWDLSAEEERRPAPDPLEAKPRGQAWLVTSAVTPQTPHAHTRWYQSVFIHNLEPGLHN